MSATSREGAWEGASAGGERRKTCLSLAERKKDSVQGEGSSVLCYACICKLLLTSMQSSSLSIKIIKTMNKVKFKYKKVC